MMSDFVVLGLALPSEEGLADVGDHWRGAGAEPDHLDALCLRRPSLRGP